MKAILIGVLAAAALFGSCAGGPAAAFHASLTATQFAEKIREFPASPVVDIRTPQEFQKGHLLNALNIDWNGPDFETEISKLDKSKPVFIYCLSGGRSASALNRMRTCGFTQVYELNGGILKWRAANLPEVGNNTSPTTGLNLQQFEALTRSDKLVLIDFYADWCIPCRKMKPYLEEIADEMSENVKVIRINADDNQQLCKDLNIEALPVLQLYKYQTCIWTNMGYISKEEVLKQLH